MANRKYTEKLKVSIDCADKELPVAIAQLGQTIKIELVGSDVALGQQLPQAKGVDLLPLLNRSAAPTLPTERRIPHG